MDCRVSLVLGLGILAGAAGCTPSATTSGVTESTSAKVVAPAGKRKPKPETCVAFGDFSLRESMVPGKTQAEQRLMREQARSAFRQALTLDPNCLEAHRGLAQAYLAENDCEHAVGAYQTILKAHPRDAATWYALGMTYSRHKDWVQAVTALKRATEFDPTNRQFGTSLGFCLARAGTYAESLAVFRPLVGEARAHYNLARMLDHTQQQALSRQHLQLALRADPTLKEAQELLARLDGAPTGTSAVVPARYEQSQPR